MTHPSANLLSPFNEMSEQSPDLVAQVCNNTLAEMDSLRRYGTMNESVESRLDRIELALLALATAVSNSTSRRGPEIW